MKKYFAIALIILIIAGGYVWFFMYNKSHTNYQEADAAFNGTAVALQESAVEDAANFNDEFLNQAVIVSGTVTEVGANSLSIDDVVLCNMADAATQKMPKPGDEITIKGRMVGTEKDILTDLLVCSLDQCVIQ